MTQQQQEVLVVQQQLGTTGQASMNLSPASQAGEIMQNKISKGETEKEDAILYTCMVHAGHKPETPTEKEFLSIISIKGSDANLFQMFCTLFETYPYLIPVASSAMLHIVSTGDVNQKQEGGEDE